MCSPQMLQNESMSTTLELKSHLEALQRRNYLLKQLRDAQIAHSQSKMKSPPSRKMVKQALRRAKEEGSLPTPVLQQIVDITNCDGTKAKNSRPITARQFSTATTRRPLAPTSINHAKKDPRLKLNLSEVRPQQTPTPEPKIGDWIPECQTARTDGSFIKDPPEESSAPATARPACPIIKTVAARSGTRYQKLLIALQLEAPSTTTKDATLKESMKEDQAEAGETRDGSDSSEPATYTPPNTYRERASSSTTEDDLEMSAKRRLKEEGGDGKRSLPGSPGWTDDMNPSHQPDGEFSMEKKHEFQKGVRNLLRVLRSGGTLLETRVASKRSKQNQEMWMATRNETLRVQQGPNNVATAMHCRTSDWKTTQLGMQANYAQTTNSSYGMQHGSHYRAARRMPAGRAFRV